MASKREGAPARAIDDGFFASVRGETQWITLRGADCGNPALLILTGPGAAFSRLAPFFATWEAAFTLVQWDQPGAGATYARHGEAALSLDRLAADAEAVAEIVLARLGAAKLAIATPPPGAHWVPDDLPLPDGRARGLAGYLALRDEIAAFDAWALGLALEVPMIFLQGEFDRYTPTAEVAAYAAAITAPMSKVVEVPGGGHSAVFLREWFLSLLQRRVLSLTKA